MKMMETIGLSTTTSSSPYNSSASSSSSSINSIESTTPTITPIVQYEDTESQPIPQCKECGSTSFVEDERSGDQICSECGFVSQERTISLEAEYRVFADDSASQSKVHYGQLYNPFMEYSLTENSRLERDEKEFLWDGMKNIEEIFFKLTKGDSVSKPVQDRAKELFQKAFRMQLAQKKGTVPMKRATGVEAVKLKRQKFSRRKQFVVTCLYQALKEQGITTWSIEHLSDQMEGIQVSKYSVKNCLKDLQLSTESVDNSNSPGGEDDQ